MTIPPASPPDQTPERPMRQSIESLLNEQDNAWGEYADWHADRVATPFSFGRIQAARTALLAAYQELEAEIADARQILVEAVDRNITVKDTLRSLASVASNGIYWRDLELSKLRSRIAELESENADLVGTTVYAARKVQEYLARIASLEAELKEERKIGMRLTPGKLPEEKWDY